ncbi:hypothetical protein [Paraburkholderia sp. 32]|uniref:hypothetical protein n=1 Tax=Paraburkholderia sp. 32 TaxID=2991057 RepID=UPI003D1B1DAD
MAALDRCNLRGDPAFLVLFIFNFTSQRIVTVTNFASIVTVVTAKTRTAFSQPSSLHSDLSSTLTLRSESGRVRLNSQVVVEKSILSSNCGLAGLKNDRLSCVCFAMANPPYGLFFGENIPLIKIRCPMPSSLELMPKRYESGKL